MPQDLPSTSNTSPKPGWLPPLWPTGYKLDVSRTFSYSEWQSHVQVVNLYFWLTGYKSEVPRTPSSGLINLLEGLIELRKTILLTRLLIYYKSIQINGQMKRWIGQGPEQRSLCPCRAWDPAGGTVRHHEALRKGTKATSSGFLWRPRYMTESLANGSWFNLQCFSLPQKSDGRTESSNPLITWLVLLGTSPHPWVGPKGHLPWSLLRNWGQETEYYSIALITQEIPRVLGAMSQELWMKTKYIFFL